MPITRRKRATPPEQPENTTTNTETTENGSVTAAQSESASGEAEQSAQASLSPAVHQAESNVQSPAPIEAQPSVQQPVAYTANGERSVAERTSGERTEATSIESGRRTARGELFRRPPQVPPQTAQPAHTQAAAPPLPAPSHEITLPLGNLLHLSYNPGYTGADEARSQLLEQLVQESKKGGRARCWNCGSVAIVYDRWNTRSKTFGEVGVAICEICGVWSVM